MSLIVRGGGKIGVSSSARGGGRKGGVSLIVRGGGKISVSSSARGGGRRGGVSLFVRGGGRRRGLPLSVAPRGGMAGAGTLGGDLSDSGNSLSSWTGSTPTVKGMHS